MGAQRWRRTVFWHSHQLKGLAKTRSQGRAVPPTLPRWNVRSSPHRLTKLKDRGGGRVLRLLTKPFPHVTTCVSCRQHEAGFCFWVHSDICLLNGVFKLLMLKVIIDIVGLIAIIIATVFYFFLSLFFCLSLFPPQPPQA